MMQKIAHRNCNNMNLKSECSRKKLSSFSMTKWKCRRGMLELDILLNQFVEKEYETLSEDQVVVLGMMLDYPDQVLYDLLLEKMNTSDQSVSELVSMIRKTALNILPLEKS